MDKILYFRGKFVIRYVEQTFDSMKQMYYNYFNM